MREYNESATIITTPWEEITGSDILATIEQENNLLTLLLEEMEHDHDHHEHHHHDHEEHECCCGHHHDHEEEHHEHHHHHDHEEHECSCGCGGHHEHGHHHADEVFTSWGLETPAKYDKEEICGILEALEEEDKYGMILRAKGMVPSADGTWIYFDYVPGEVDVREGKPDVTGKLCVIGANLKEENLQKLFVK